MKLTAFTFLLSLCAIPTAYSHHIPKTCQCPQVEKKIQGPFSDFKVIPKGPNCLKHEIIVTLQRNNKKVCLSAEDKQGKRLMKCWHRNDKDSHKCLRKQKQKARQRRRKQTKPKKRVS